MSVTRNDGPKRRFTKRTETPIHWKDRMIPIGIQSYLLRRHDWTLQTYITVSPIIFFGRYENGFLGSYIGIPFYFEGDNWFGGELIWS